jgi:hypothetical protein
MSSTIKQIDIDQALKHAKEQINRLKFRGDLASLKELKEWINIEAVIKSLSGRE